MRIKLRYLVRSGGPNFIPSVRGPVCLVRSEKYTQPTVNLFPNQLSTYHLIFIVSMIMISTMHMLIIITTGEQSITM